MIKGRWKNKTWRRRRRRRELEERSAVKNGCLAPADLGCSRRSRRRLLLRQCVGRGAPGASVHARGAAAAKGLRAVSAAGGFRSAERRGQRGGLQRRGLALAILPDDRGRQSIARAFLAAMLAPYTPLAPQPLALFDDVAKNAVVSCEHITTGRPQRSAKRPQ